MVTFMLISWLQKSIVVTFCLLLEIRSSGGHKYEVREDEGREAPSVEPHVPSDISPCGR
jgi:hypothetical protein